LDATTLQPVFTTMYYRLLVNRCPLLENKVKWKQLEIGTCRFGCNQPETPGHVFLKCPNTQKERHEIKKFCLHNGMNYDLQSILYNTKLKLPVEKLLLKVFTSGNKWNVFTFHCAHCDLPLLSFFIVDTLFTLDFTV